MKRGLGVGRCGLACCLCSQNTDCKGCNSGECRDKNWCEDRNCSLQKGLPGCYACKDPCRRGIREKLKPYGFSLFIQRYGMDELLTCLERNERNGIVYHREGIYGDYDGFSDVENLIRFIKTGKK